jgi:hypothetical protein
VLIVIVGIQVLGLATDDTRRFAFGALLAYSFEVAFIVQTRSK